MRILVLTHERSGGLSLITWIASELTCEIIHEPDLTDQTIKHKVLTDNDIIVKIFPEHIDPNEFNEFLNTFDKIIIHKRDNVNDVAVSLFYSEEKRDVNKNLHDTYEFDYKCKEDNKDKIEHCKQIVIKKHEILDNINHPNIIRTSYDSIYYNDKDVIKICDYINVINPIWLDVINNKRKLQNGKIGMEDFRIIKRNIRII
jgi:hypothetical protein